MSQLREIVTKTTDKPSGICDDAPHGAVPTETPIATSSRFVRPIAPVRPKARPFGRSINVRGNVQR